MKIRFWLGVFLPIFTALSFSCSGGKDNPAKSQTILFLGDSITEAGFYVIDIESALTHESPGHPPHVINRGRDSETVSGLTEANFPGNRPCLFSRLDNELFREKPDWVIACYGINCGIYQPLDEKRFKAYQDGMENLIEKVHAAGSRLILLTPPPYADAGPPFPDGTDPVTREKMLVEANSNALVKLEKNPNRYGYRDKYPYYDQVMKVYADWLKTLDQRDGVWVIDVRGAMLPRLAECYDADPVHPNRTGHRIMAETFLASWPIINKEADIEVKTKISE